MPAGWHWFCSFLWLSNIPYYQNIPYVLYPFMLMDIYVVSTCAGYCKQHCSEHWGACIFSSYGFSGYMPRIRITWSSGFALFQFVVKEPPHCFPLWLCQFTFPLTVWEDSLWLRRILNWDVTQNHILLKQDIEEHYLIHYFYNVIQMESQSCCMCATIPGALIVRG